MLNASRVNSPSMMCSLSLDVNHGEVESNVSGGQKVGTHVRYRFRSKHRGKYEVKEFKEFRDQALQGCF
jgi:hypothetical protein